MLWKSWATLALKDISKFEAEFDDADGERLWAPPGGRPVQALLPDRTNQVLYLPGVYLAYTVDILVLTKLLSGWVMRPCPIVIYINRSSRRSFIKNQISAKPIYITVRI